MDLCLSRRRSCHASQPSSRFGHPARPCRRLHRGGSGPDDHRSADRRLSPVSEVRWRFVWGAQPLHRTLSDLPVAGRRVVITVSVRRFPCLGPECRTKVFAERPEPDLATAYVRRTGRLETIVHHLGLALGGRPAESFARRLMVPAGRARMLRTVRRRARRPAEILTVIGIDDWAFRCGQRYGTLICDLERQRVVALLPDRESGTVEAWLTAHPEIAVLARDRGGGYGEAAARGKASEFEGSVENLYGQAKDAVRDVAGQAGDIARDAVSQGRERFPDAERAYRQGADTVTPYAKESPLTLAVMAGAIGYLLALVIHGRS